MLINLNFLKISKVFLIIFLFILMSFAFAENIKVNGISKIGYPAINCNLPSGSYECSLYSDNYNITSEIFLEKTDPNSTTEISQLTLVLNNNTNLTLMLDNNFSSNYDVLIKDFNALKITGTVNFTKDQNISYKSDFILDNINYLVITNGSVLNINLSAKQIIKLPDIERYFISGASEILEVGPSDFIFGTSSKPATIINNGTIN
ncbi:MAG: hypothetical protein V1824_01310 [archaeon]